MLWNLESRVFNAKDCLLKHPKDFTCWMVVGFKINFILLFAMSLYWNYKLFKKVCPKLY
jgi:hypothetical protein